MLYSLDYRHHRTADDNTTIRQPTSYALINQNESQSVRTTIKSKRYPHIASHTTGVTFGLI